MATQDPWDTSTGLLDEFDFEVETAWFGFDDNYRDGEALLFKMRGVATIDGEVEDDEHTVQFSCGNGWVDSKGGEQAKHAGGGVQFNEKTGMGYLLRRLKDLDVVEQLREKGKPTEAATFVGLNMHMKREAVNTFTPKGETEPVTQYVTLPQEMLDGSASKPAKKSRGRKAAAKADDDGDDEEEAPKPKRSRKRKPSLRDAVIEFASEFDDHAEFVAAVFDPDEFDRAEEAEADEELSEEILDADSELWEESQS